MKDVRRNFFLMAAAAIALVAAGCTTEMVEAPAVAVVMDPDAPVTEVPPVWMVGSVWTYDQTTNGETRRHTNTIIEEREVDGRLIHVVAKSPPNREPGGTCNGANGELFDAVTHNWMACLKDGEILGSLSPHNGHYEWPLEVGKNWRFQRTWTDNVNPQWSGPGWEEFTVVAWEEVTVPVGTFMAYKVVRTKTSWQTKSEENSIVWYAPDFGAGVKGTSAYYTNSGLVENRWEMVDRDPMELPQS